MTEKHASVTHVGAPVNGSPRCGLTTSGYDPKVLRSERDDRSCKLPTQVAGAVEASDNLGERL